MDLDTAIDDLLTSALVGENWECAAVCFRALCGIVPYFVWVALTDDQRLKQSVLSQSPAIRRCRKELSQFVLGPVGPATTTS